MAKFMNTKTGNTLIVHNAEAIKLMEKSKLYTAVPAAPAKTSSKKSGGEQAQ